MTIGSTSAATSGPATKSPDSDTAGTPPFASSRRRRTLSTLAVSGLCLALAACGSSPKPQKKVKFSEEKYGVSASPRVVEGSKPVPKGGGRYMVGKPYKVAGKWYRPKHDPDYESVGLASWYGPTFHGRMTANGEVFDRNALTAAHTTMPLPSYARVKNLENGRSMIVRVNDRGPFHGNRTIDLSERVATMLDFKHKGVAKVKVEYLGRARMDGKDEPFLMASYDGPGAVNPGATMPHTLLAKATIPGGIIGPVPVPTARPYGGTKVAARGDFARVASAGIDPGAVFEESGVRVASLDARGQAPGTSGALGYGASTTADLPPFDGATAFDRDPALSSYAASRRVAQAHDAFARVSGGSSLAKLVRNRQ